MSEPQAGYYTVKPPGSEREIHLSLDTLDGILADVLTGFGAIPRRGAEVGGVLFGRESDGAIWIDRFVMAPCEHRRGPSFLLSEKDLEGFEAIFAEPAMDGDQPVGMFRSNTRDADEVTNDDRELFGRHFPAPNGVFLLIHPYASKTSRASFLVYRDGALPATSSESFPFLRRELEGEPAPARRPLSERAPRPALVARPPAAQLVTQPEAPPPPPQHIQHVTQYVPEPLPRMEREPTREYEPPPHAPVIVPQAPRSWVWIPLSFLFLMVGVALGYEFAQAYNPRVAETDPANFALGLSATAKDENVLVKWRGDSAAIRAASGGKLEIKDGGSSRTVDLDQRELQTGSVMYPPTSDNVEFQLRVQVKPNNLVSESYAWSKRRP